MPDSVFSVRIIQSDGDAVVINDAMAVRIVSRYYNLLIMRDYMPIIGEIWGSVVVMGRSSRYVMKDGVAYFVNRNNEFTLIIKEDHGVRSGFLSVDVGGRVNES